MLRGIVMLWMGQIVNKILGFIAFAFLARRLGAQDYGTVEYAMGLATIAALAAEGGMGAVGVRRLVQGERSARMLAAVVPAAQSCLAALVVPGVVAFAWMFGGDARAVTLVALVSASVLLLPWKQDWLFQAHGKMGHIVAEQTLRASLFAAAVILFVAGDADLVQVGVAEIASVGAATLYLVAMQTRSIGPASARFAWRDILDLGREGASIGAAAVVWALIQYVPLVMLANIAGMADAAHFGAAHRLGVSLVTFSWIYHYNFYPTIAQRMIGDPEAMAMLTRGSFRIAAWGGIGLALAVTLTAEPLLALLFGEPFRAGAPALGVLVWTFPVTLLSGHARWILVAARRARDMLVAQIVGGVVAVVAGALLIGRFGAVGAGAAMLLATFAIWAVAQALVAVEVRAAPLLPCVLPAALAAAILILARSLAADPWIAGAAGVSAFCVLAPLLDRALLRDLSHFAGAASSPPPNASVG